MPIAAPQHKCRQTTNPRHPGLCACGRRLEPLPEPRTRSLEFERGITNRAARGAVDASALIVHSETRARTLSGGYVSDHMLIQPGRDRLRDVREELSDARNHLVWWIYENPEDDRVEEAMVALRFVALAYDRMVEGD